MNADTTTIATPDFNIKVIARREYERNPAPRVFVADEIAATRSDELAELQGQERALGDRRFAERGRYADVDDLYDRLNAEIMRVKLEIAQAALIQVADYVTGDWQSAADHAFFSIKAGCDTCPCSPGVITGGKLTWDDWDGSEFNVWVEAA